MSDSRIDYSDLVGLADEYKKKYRRGYRKWARVGRHPAHARALSKRIAFWTTAATVVALLPFMLLIRGGVVAYQAWGLGTWPSLLLSASASAALLAGYAWIVGHRFGAGRRVKVLASRAAAAVAVAYVGYGLVFVASENVKSDDVRAGYGTVHPLLRVAASALILADAESVITDAGRTPDDYVLMGLPMNEASLHFQQETGYVHALDLRTSGRSEVRNRMVQMGFRALGFRTLRHVGTADHLHLSLRPPG